MFGSYVLLAVITPMSRDLDDGDWALLTEMALPNLFGNGSRAQILLDTVKQYPVSKDVRMVLGVVNENNEIDPMDTAVRFAQSFNSNRARTGQQIRVKYLDSDDIIGRSIEEWEGEPLAESGYVPSTPHKWWTPPLG